MAYETNRIRAKKQTFSRKNRIRVENLEMWDETTEITPNDKNIERK